MKEMAEEREREREREREKGEGQEGKRRTFSLDQRKHTRTILSLLRWH